MSIQTRDNEALESFVDQFIDDVKRVDVLVAQLIDAGAFSNAVNTLFRIFHNHASVTSFLKIDDILACANKALHVLGVVREQGMISDETEVDWFELLSSQLQMWADELELGITDLSPINEKIFTLLKIQEVKTPISQTISELKLLYLNSDPVMGPKYVPVFEKIFSQVIHLSESEDLALAIKTHTPDIIMLTQEFINSKTHQALTAHDDIIPAIALLKDDSQRTLLKLIHQGIHYHIPLPINSASLKNVLHSMVGSHFSSRKLIISNKKIRAFIETLDPLSDTIVQIQKVCDDEHSCISDLVKIIKNDPVTSGIILNATKFPIYALKNISNIDQAVSIFGKRTIKALALGGLQSNFPKIDLSMYGIDEVGFLDVSHLRMKLMTQWYTKVNKAHLDTLAIASLLGNLGQLLIAKEIKSQGKESDFFYSLSEKGIMQTENDLLRTSTSAVTSDILYFWNMPSQLVDVLSYSDSPLDAIEEIQPLSVACHIVFSLIPLSSARILPVSEEIQKLLAMQGLNKEDLLQAIEETKNP